MAVFPTGNVVRKVARVRFSVRGKRPVGAPTLSFINDECTVRTLDATICINIKQLIRA